MEFKILASISPDGAKSLAKIMSRSDHPDADIGIRWLKRQAEEWEETATKAIGIDNQMRKECAEYARVFKEAYEIAIAERI